MLTRDINLEDAILDLLDNCVDGILRLQEGKFVNASRPYGGYEARIVASPTEFTITDNCGGISRQIATESAFRFGRADPDRDSGIRTVGMYGIGMKRAIFKMGQQARVASQHDGDAFEVRISPTWLEDDSDWFLPLHDSSSLGGHNGTTIEIAPLRPNIGRMFDPAKSNFLARLEKEIAKLFAIIITKGFAIYLNGKVIAPMPVRVLYDSDFSDSTIQPYVYRGEVDTVHISIAVGFYKKPPTVQQVEDEQGLTRSRDNAGWTVICNDRVVLMNDKTEVTGWGQYSVPKYHNQFMSISGVVVFTGYDPLKLPLNTTKRGIELGSEVYARALLFMCEGTKKFTEFTNRWKGRDNETAPYFSTTKLVDPLEVANRIPDDKWQEPREANHSEQVYSPNLPLPSKSDTRKRITFYREQAHIELIASAFLDGSSTTPSEVGEFCFDRILDDLDGGKR